MSITHNQNFKDDIDFEVIYESASETTETKMLKVKEVKLNKIKIVNLVEFIYEKLDSSNNLRNPIVRLSFDSLAPDKQKKFATVMFIYRYCIHRIMTHFKAYDRNMWQYFIEDDYHSQEVSEIKLKSEVALEIDTHLRYLINIPIKRKIEYVLTLEYGKLLPSVTNKNWLIGPVSKDDLHFSNQTHYERCSESDLSYLNGYNLPRGLCIKQSNGKYKVIDGYHRLCAAEKLGDNFLVIYAED